MSFSRCFKVYSNIAYARLRVYCIQNGSIISTKPFHKVKEKYN